MSDVKWSCYRDRFPFGGPALVAECAAPDVQAAIATLAQQLRRPAASIAPTPKEFAARRDTATPAEYWVESHASRRVREEKR